MIDTMKKNGKLRILAMDVIILRANNCNYFKSYLNI